MYLNIEYFRMYSIHISEHTHQLSEADKSWTTGLKFSNQFVPFCHNYFFPIESVLF